MVEIFLIRHGQTDWNIQRRLQGHTDIPLNEVGRAQSLRLKDVLAEHQIDAFFSSDLVRAIDTAKIARASESVPLIIDPGLREAGLGEAEGLLFEELDSKFPDCYTKWLSTGRPHEDFSFPGGESKLQHRERLEKTFHKLFAAHPYQRVGIVTHGGAIRRVLELSTNFSEVTFRTRNTSVYHLQYQRAEKQLQFVKKVYSPE